MSDGLTTVTTIITVVATVVGTILIPLILLFFKICNKRTVRSGPDTESQNRPSTPKTNHFGNGSMNKPVNVGQSTTTSKPGDTTTSNQLVASEINDKTRTKVGMEPVCMGACGYPGEGTPFSHPGYDGIKKIIIYCKSGIESIEVQYTKNGQIKCPDNVGGKSGNREEFVFDDDEYLTEVKGFYGRRCLYRMGAISSLTFFSNKKNRFGPYGIDEGTQNKTLIEAPGTTPFHIKGGKIVGFHGTQGQYFLSSIGFDIASVGLVEASLTQMDTKVGMEPVYMGACGYPGEGTPFYHFGYDGINKIFIYYESVINSIEVQYSKNGQIECLDKVGGKGGNREEIVLEDGEYLIEVNGYFGRLDNVGTLTCITFISNLNKTFGPYGNDKSAPLEKKSPFSVKGGKIVGFHGNSGPNFLSAIGLYVAFHPIGNIICTGQWGHSYEGSPFDHKSNDGIKRIVVYCGWVIDTIDVQYRNNGQLEWSDKIGRKGGNRRELVLDDDEYLTEVKGFYGRLFGMDTINSLTFFSNKKRRFGPYGIDEGTQRDKLEAKPTPFHVKEGKIVGFHGTQGEHYLSAIGFYIAPGESMEAPSTQMGTQVGIEQIYMGACGYPGEGTPFCHPGYDGIKKIIIYCKSVIDSIDVQYTKNGQIKCPDKVGGKGGNHEEIVLEDGEYLTEVNGYYGRLDNVGALNCITFISNLNKTFGPYGTDKPAPMEKKSPFSVKGGKIIGFHGNSGPNFLSAIGFYVAFHPVANST